MKTNKTELGHNLTGGQLSPSNLRKMLKACEEFPADVPGDVENLEKARIQSIKEVDLIGSIPLPVSVKGVLKSSFNKLIGNQPEVFLDKLGERLAFERSGVRLYEAAIAKAHGLKASKTILNQLKHIRDEEAQHMELIVSTIQKLGADPTAMTPCADITGVLGQGIMQVLCDPRTTMIQALDALLNAELIDNAAWELLIELAQTHGQKQVVEDFEKALQQEQEHLSMIKSLIKSRMEIK